MKKGHATKELPRGVALKTNRGGVSVSASGLKEGGELDAVLSATGG